MSSGQKSCAMDDEEDAWREHHDRLAQLGPSEIVKIVDDMTMHFRYLEESVQSLPRGGWYRIDEIKKLLKKLS